jgi:hypothetical protein
MEITGIATALPSRGAWGSFASRLLEGVSAVYEYSKQQRMMLAARELDPGALADMEAAARGRDIAKMRGMFEGHSVMILE